MLQLWCNRFLLEQLKQVFCQPWQARSSEAYRNRQKKVLRSKTNRKIMAIDVGLYDEITAFSHFHSSPPIAHGSIKRLINSFSPRSLLVHIERHTFVRSLCVMTNRDDLCFFSFPSSRPFIFIATLTAIDDSSRLVIAENLAAVRKFSWHQLFLDKIQIGHDPLLPFTVPATSLSSG